jgi:thiol-disulfide isomerase/thioredoxin
MHRHILSLTMLSLIIGLLVGCDSPEGSLKVGTKAPQLRTKTLADVGGDLSRITTYRYPDERMYQYSLDKALQSGKLILLEFATPAHCTVCDKQLQMIKQVINDHKDDLLVLHMDQYENPDAYTAFRVKGDPWTFLIDKEGTVRFKRPGRMIYSELNVAIDRVLDKQPG